MERAISPLKDIVSLWRLWRAMRKLSPRYDVGTPKAGLLAGLAAWLNRVPCRLYAHGYGLKPAKVGSAGSCVCGAAWHAGFAHRVVWKFRACAKRQSLVDFQAGSAPVVLGSGSCNGNRCSRLHENRGAKACRGLTSPAEYPQDDGSICGRFDEGQRYTGADRSLSTELRKQFGEFRLVWRMLRE